MPEQPRSYQARAYAEAALVRLVRAYGETPEFVLLGGLVPDLLCSGAPRPHEGTTDVDVQVDLEIQNDATNAKRLESALEQSGFDVSPDRIWRWRDESIPGVVIKIEFLADLSNQPAQAIIVFEDCTSLGAVNLRGTRFASQDWVLRPITTTIDAESVTVDVRVATLPAYLLAKSHAAYGRGLVKDWYDIAYVVLHNDEGGPGAAAHLVRGVFGAKLVGQTETALGELGANFARPDAQGCAAYAHTMCRLHPELDVDVLANDALAGVNAFLEGLGITTL
jgi:hypothetical protein